MFSGVLFVLSFFDDFMMMSLNVIECHYTDVLYYIMNGNGECQDVRCGFCRHVPPVRSPWF